MMEHKPRVTPVTPSQPTLNNPYLPDATDDNVKVAPFVGRQRAFEHVYQRLTEPQGAGVSLVLGRRDIGKTAFLKHFHDYFDDSFITAYLPLKTFSPQNEAEWLTTLALETMQALAQRDFSMYRLPKPETDNRNLRDWLIEDYLAEVFSMISQCRMVWLFDDADRMLEWIRMGALPADSFSYLHQVARRVRGLGMVMAMDEQFENRIPSLSPLVGLTDVFRLTNLSVDETTALLQKPVEGLYRLEDEVAGIVYRATAGAPRLAQHFGFQFYQHWEAAPNPFTADDVKAVTNAVYNQSKPAFEDLWSALQTDEQRVMAAVSQLIYADPLSPIDATDLERWLVETDHPMDRTAVQSALRGLEYRQIIENERGKIRIAAQLLQTQFLENARFKKATQVEFGEAKARSQWQPLALVAILLILLVLLAIIVGQQGANNSASGLPQVPTVTLVSGA